jgi:hypothetical protein
MRARLSLLAPLLRRVLAVAVPMALLWAAYLAGQRVGAAGERLAQAAAQAQAVEAARAEERQRQTITLRVDFQYLRAVQDLQIVYQAITREVPRYVTPAADHACPVTAGFAELHDAAAGARLPILPAAPGGADAATGLPLSAVAETVTRNYARCAETATRLVSLQDWVRQQAALTSTAPAP